MTKTRIMMDGVVIPGSGDVRALVALDAGQSGSRARVLTTPDLGAAVRECSLDAVLTNRDVIPQLAQRAGEALATAWPSGVPEHLGASLAVGSTGLAATASAIVILSIFIPQTFIFVIYHPNINEFVQIV